MLSIGKRRGLAALAAPNGTFSMLALDHRNSFRRLTAGIFPDGADWARMVDEKARLARALLPHASAALLDPLYGAGPLVARGVVPGAKGFLVALEQSGYRDTPEGRVNRVEPGWSVAAIARLGAAGVKLLIQYHPGAANAAAQEDLVARTAEACAARGLPLVLEPVTYAPEGDKTAPEFQAALPELIPQVAARLGALGVDLLKLEFPLAGHQDPARMEAACAGVSAATDLPWVVLSAAVPFDTFLAQTRAACAGGASGFLAGRSVWQEAMALADPAARDGYLARVAAPRMAALRAVTDAAATPWTDRPGAGLPALSEGWHLAHAAPAPRPVRRPPE
ncbi:MAG: tagatose 1,6-diphosphate aldolase [Pseudomonadota bacterium]